MAQILVVDTGGQYCHLIARRVREAGVQACISAPDRAIERLPRCKGVIISGGPRSVYASDAVHCPPELFGGRVSVLGICYGHQLMAHALGGIIRPGVHREFGETRLRILGQDTILKGVESNAIVWMSHGDEVVAPPPSFDILGETDHCRIAAMVNNRRTMFGLQFHPEVTHTQYGNTIFKNFLFAACRCTPDWSIASQISEVQERIRSEVGNRRLLFFVSGGVDSTVAFALCSHTLGPDRVLGVFVDTGFMRKGERAQIEAAFMGRGWGNIRFVDARREFVSSVRGISDPEKKRLIIGNCFLDVQRQVSRELDLSSGEWMLGQGTIYPDTIESGGTKDSAKIKTHHNRVPEIAKLIRDGLLLEPLVSFYKDEVRQIGRELGLPEQMVRKHPFPGPGLAVRCLCSEDDHRVEVSDELRQIVRSQPCLDGVSVPIRTVGVQGDYRSYSNVVLLSGDAVEREPYGAAAKRITNEIRATNRVTYLVRASKGAGIHSACVRRRFIDWDRLELLRQADAVVSTMLERFGLVDRVWQFPVVLVPLTFSAGETIALRPVVSADAMTARYADLPRDFVDATERSLLAIPGIDAVIYDVTSKPPATIEWE